MTGYKRGDAKQRGVAALSAPAPRSASDEFRETNFEYAIQSFTFAQSSGSPASLLSIRNWKRGSRPLEVMRRKNLAVAASTKLRIVGGRFVKNALVQALPQL